MTGDDDTLLTVPVVAWPARATPGSRHIVTVDLRGPLTGDDAWRHADDETGETGALGAAGETGGAGGAGEDGGGLGPWPWPEEELGFTVGLDGGSAFACKALGEPLLLLHRFGGTYEPVEFLVVAADTVGPAGLWLTLNNEHGMPVHSVDLPVEIVAGGEEEAPWDDGADGGPAWRSTPEDTPGPHTGTGAGAGAEARAGTGAETGAGAGVEEPPVTVVHAGADSAWAHWAADAIRRRGRAARLRTETARGDRGPAHLLDRLREPAAGPVLLLLGPAFLARGGHAPGAWEAALAARGGAFPEGLHLAAVDDGPLPRLPDGTRPLRLTAVDGERAEEDLARRLGLPPRPADTGPLVRHPGRAPAGLGSLPPRNHDFTGRDVLLERIRRRLGRGTPLALVGMGGVGKTQLAAEYAHRFASQYEVVWWVSGENPATYRSQLASLPLAPDPSAEPGRAQGFRTVLDALRRGVRSPWLVVVDGADAPADLRDHLPSGPGHVLTTSRSGLWESHEAQVLEVPVYDRAEAVEWARAHAPGLSPTEAEALAEAVGDLPLALAQATAWLVNSGQPVRRYLDLVDAWLEEGDPGGPAGFAATWTVTLRELEREAPLSLELLRLCAHFAPGPVPVGMLDALVGEDVPPRLRALFASPDAVRQAVEPLLRYSLVSRAPDRGTGLEPCLGVHGLVHAQVRAGTPHGAREDCARLVRRALAACDPGDPADVRVWPVYEEMARHLPHCGALTEVDAAPSVLRCLRQMYLAAEYDYGLELAETAREAWVGRASDDVLRELDHQYANFLRAVGDFARSMTVGDALVRQETTDTGYIRAAGGYAADLRGLGRFQEALRFCGQVHAICRARTGEGGDGHLATSLNNLAVTLRLLGRCPEALALDEQALELRQGALGGGHPWTLWSAYQVALDLRLLGEVRHALALQETNLALTVDLLGPDRAQTLSVRHNWAQCLRAVGETAAAGDEIRRTLDDAARTLGGRNLLHLQIAASAAMFERRHGDPERGLDLASETWRGYAAFLGGRHPFTLGARANLAAALAARDPREASRAAAEAHTGLAAALGGRHPWTTGCGRLREALPLGGEPEWEFEALVL
ncbi:FxSxx-COOH system tetratricopeptide repeat protein [Streptomyces sp. NPDC005012]|uniref:FxSxx-COOH system tetratricopeptide repeat protein n=1 Tax=Streptomyces sp. NPDC005012 TaxID=3154558 RepID=UPI0033A4D31D